jgi:hypothetical protein
MGPLAGGVLYQLNSSMPYAVAAVALLPMICFVWFMKE